MTSTALAQSGNDVVNTATGEVLPVRVDMTSYLSRLSSNEAITEQKQLSAAYDRACDSLIGANDVQVEGGRTFKKKSAWRKLARHFGISTAVVNVQKESEGSDFLCTVTVRASAPWGQYTEAVGSCGTDEATGRRIITRADAIATAETRATNRAVSNLVAMGEVSAEEIGKGNPTQARNQSAGSAPAENASAPQETSSDTSRGPLQIDEETCPKCGGRMWDNRLTKRNPRAPDYKCRDRSCDGVIWPPKDGEKKAPVTAALVPENFEDFPQALEDTGDDLPF